MEKSIKNPCNGSNCRDRVKLKRIREYESNLIFFRGLRTHS